MLYQKSFESNSIKLSVRPQINSKSQCLPVSNETRFVLFFLKLTARFWLIEFDVIIYHSIALLILYQTSIELNSIRSSKTPKNNETEDVADNSQLVFADLRSNYSSDQLKPKSKVVELFKGYRMV